MMTNDDVRKNFEVWYESLGKVIPQAGYEHEPMDAAYLAHASQQARIDALEAKLAELKESYLLRVISDIREVTGLGYKPMLSELADAIKAKLAELSKDAEQHLRGCWCEFCNMKANGGLRTRMSICPNCGDKRCDKAKYHESNCTQAIDEAIKKDKQ